MGPDDEFQTEDGRGTRGYRPPEFLLNEQQAITVTCSVDIWAVGCILFELWQGRKAFQKDWNTREYYLTHDHFMDDGELKCPDVTFSKAADTIFWREIERLTSKEPESRPKSQKLLERVREIQGFNDAAVQTDPIVICPPVKKLPGVDSTEEWTVRDAVVSSTSPYIVIGSYGQDRRQYRIQLWSIEPETILWEDVVNPVIPTFSQDGRYLVLNSGDTLGDDTLELMETVGELKIIGFKSTNPVAAMCVRNGGVGIAYSYNEVKVTSTTSRLINKKTESKVTILTADSKPVDVVISTPMSDVSIAYDPDECYLYAIGKPQSYRASTLKGYVWDLTSDGRNCIKYLTFSDGDYRELPLRAFSLADRTYLTVLSTNPRESPDEVRTILRMYTRKGTLTSQFGCGWLIFTPSLEGVFILSVGKLLYHDRDLPEYDEFEERSSRWCYVDCPAPLSNRVEDYNATGSKLPLCLWRWDGEDKKPQWVGRLTADVSDFEDVKAFVPHEGKVKLWLENGAPPVNSSIERKRENHRIRAVAIKNR